MEQRTRARELRANPTEAEIRLWRAISARKVSGVRFNRQVPIGPFICDFVSRSAGLIIEVDGGQHAATTEQNAARTRYLENEGYRVIRFWNDDVTKNLEGVIAEIERILTVTPSPNPVTGQLCPRHSLNDAGHRSPVTREREGS
ncbi:endonuclease domain-containing protein [Sphingomonas sp. GB1N7]|uniref:endonuclease domain-containing protein n=1 Tax=Parasphingomonas caseinilytica TaxID=3096158 RepID=UPI002FC68914